VTSPANDERRRKSLESIERRLEELPNLSSVVTRLALMDPNSTGFTAQVEMLVREDPPLATRLLRYASKNGYPVRTIPQAIARVGARPLAELITSMSVQRVFVPSNLGQRNLWLHAIQVAVAARIYAQNRPELQTDPEEAYFAGLLHDVGRFVMFDRSPAELGQVDEIGWTTPDELITRNWGGTPARLGIYQRKSQP
jgi:HD-like signal output (HDOD) protein